MWYINQRRLIRQKFNFLYTRETKCNDEDSCIDMFIKLLHVSPQEKLASAPIGDFGGNGMPSKRIITLPGNMCCDT